MTELLFSELALLIPVFPFIGFLTVLSIGKKVGGEEGGYLAVMGITISWLLSLLIGGQVLLKLLLEEEEEITVIHDGPWIEIGQFSVNWGVLIDPLSSFMLVVVSTLCLIIAVYSLGYMHDESENYTLSRYYAEFSLFVASMLGLILAPNFIMLFIFWEGVGLCSYLLIGFFYDREEMIPEPARSAKKAFLTNKFGDVAMMIGFILLWVEFKKAGIEPTLSFAELAEHFQHGGSVDNQVLIGILIFGGAIGKSAQFPLHVWLPDAMAGPTTVSALIHSATMVKAGIFMVARTYWLFWTAGSDHGHATESEDALLFIAVIGGITAILSATIALVTTDIKGILAFSTISQLGYMTIALGVGAMGAGMFHLMNHAVFKALLFLTAGSVIHSAHTQDIREMGGLGKEMKITATTMLVGSLALAGIFPLNGFFSKDAVILETYLRWEETGDPLILFVFISAVLTAFLTAFYIFRMWFLVFAGKSRDEHRHAHESPKIMTIPLMILATFAVLLGLISAPGLLLDDVNLSFEHKLVEWLQPGHHVETDYLFGHVHIMAVVSLVVAVIGLTLAYLVYWTTPEETIVFKETTGFEVQQVASKGAVGQLQAATRSTQAGIVGLPIIRSYQTVLENGYYIDAFYLFIVHMFNEIVSEGLSRFDKGIVDGLVNLVGTFGVAFCGLQKWFDEKIIDGTVNLIGKGCALFGNYLRKIQTGVVENYGNLGAIGLILILLVLLLM
ncbi:MAG: NADH-quinone oxidoreductase subunit L [Candidatus Heimdallarchaeota archaeon]